MDLPDPLAALDHIGYPDQDPHEDARAIAVELRSMADDQRSAILRELPRWLVDPSLARQGIAMDLAVEFQDADLMRAAVEEAARRGIHDEPHTDPRPSWLTYHLMFLPQIVGFPTAEGLRYLEHCADEAAAAQSPSRRELAARACLFLAFWRSTEPKEAAGSCLRTIRSWGDKFVIASALALLSTRLERHPEFADLLEPRELEYARSFLPQR